MKIKNIFAIAGFVGLLVFNSCNDRIDLKPTNLIEEDFFTTEENAFMAVVGCYDVIGWEGVGQIGVNTFFADIVGRDTYKGGAGVTDQPWMNTFINFTFNNNETIIEDAWSVYYIGIGRCNKALKFLPEMTDVLSQDQINRYVSELHFIRGYFYFQLVQQFGEVPLVDKLLSPEQYKGMKKSTKEDIYKFVENEMKAAEKYLPEILSADERGRASKGMAMTFRAKTYLYAKNWVELKKITDYIMEDTDWYKLEDNYEDIFKLENENSKEIIFSIQYETSEDPDAYGNVYEGSQLNAFLMPRKEPYVGIGGWGFNCPTAEFEAEFEEADSIRREATILYQGETLWEGTDDEHTFEIPWETNIDGMNCQKYILPKSQWPASEYCSPINWIQIRYAELILWDAEAEYHTGGDWEESLNLVRGRVGLGDSPYNSDPLKAIYHERRVELGLEGHRFWDVVRQGRGTEVYGEFGYVEGKTSYLPIPKNQEDLNGGSY